MEAPKAESLVEKKRKEDIRLAIIRSGRVVEEAIRTSLGPKGMDKRISTGEVIISNEPVAKMLVELSKLQYSVAGDGTTKVNVIGGLLFKQIQTLLMRGIQLSVIRDAVREANAKLVDILTAMAVPVELTDSDRDSKNRKEDMLPSNIKASRDAVADIIRTTLGPERLEKKQKMEVLKPAAKFVD